MVKRVRYFLSSQSLGRVRLLNDPDGWNDDTRSLKRETKGGSYGILYDFATDLTFTKDGFDFIITTQRLEGFEAIIKCEREVLNFNDRWQTDYIGFVDLIKKQEQRDRITVSLIYGGVTEILKSNLNEKYTLSRTQSLTNVDIGDLIHETTLINGRDLNVVTLLEDKEEKEIIATQIIGSGGISLDKQSYYVPRLTKIFSGDPNVDTVSSVPLKPFETVSQFRPQLNSTHAFLFRSSEEKTVNINVKIDCDITIPINGIRADLGIYKHVFVDALNPFVYVGGQTLLTLNYNGVAGEVKTVNQTFNVTENVQENEHLSLVWYIQVLTGVSGQSPTLYIVDQREVSINMEQTSSFRQTNASGLTLYNASKRLSQIITGTNVVKSNSLTLGEFKDVILTNGKRIRGFEDSIELSYKDLFQSLLSVFNIYYGIEQNNEGENIVLEDLEYFFRPEIGLQIGRLTEITKTYKEDLMFSTINIGYKKGGDYEERQGLDEYNTNSDFTFNFNKIDNKADYASEFRADTIGIELTRRKQKVDFPDEDTQEDKDNFIIDCYQSSGVYINRPFTYDFNSPPQGLFSPETAYNLRLTPKNNLFRVSNSLSALAFYPNKETVFVSSFRNSDVITFPNGEPDRVENGNNVNSELNKPLFLPVEVVGKYKLNDAEFAYLTGKTDGIPNYYKVISYIDDKGVTSYGYLLSYDPNDEGVITLLKANFNL